MRNIVEKYRKIQSNCQDLNELLELGEEEFLPQIEESLTQLSKDTKDFQLQILFTGEFDDHNAILEIHPGAGGTEAQDWADMLYRMYVLYAETNKFKMALLLTLE